MDEKYIQMIIENSQSCKSANRRLDKVENEIGEIKELTIAVKELAMETKATREDVNDMNGRLKVVEEKPAKKWEDLIKTIITRNCNSSYGLFFSKTWIIKWRGGKNMKSKFLKILASILFALSIILGIIVGFQETGKINTEEIYKAVDLVTEVIETYAMTDEEVKDLPTSEILEQTEEEENKVGAEQQVTETEGFLLQGDIAYNGDKEFPSISLGNYQGLTYYSQIDSRWSNHSYTSVGNPNQTIGSSGCGPTSASMVVTAIKGVITPPEMGDLFAQHGFRSADKDRKSVV